MVKGVKKLLTNGLFWVDMETNAFDGKAGNCSDGAGTIDD